jgi:fatty acid desaturase
VEDWERFFVEKSRRRSERKRGERRRARAILTIAAAIVGLLFAAAIAGLANLT